MKLTGKTLFACVVAAAATAANAGAQAHDHDSADHDAIVIEVDMLDHAFSPTPLRIPAGRRVTLVFENIGEAEHEFMAGRGASGSDFEVDLFATVDVEIETVTTDGHDSAATHDHAPDAPPHDHADAADQDHAGGNHGTMVGLEAGGRATMTFTLPTSRRGEWEMACFLPRHYERGMHGALTVY